MRAILALIGLAALVLVVLMSLGMVRVEQTNEMAFPTVTFDGGRAPEFQADVGRVGIGETNKTIEVPTVALENKTVTLPTLEVRKAGDE